jgi:glycosyltransferase involved in cell wall biosynthesis
VDRKDNSLADLFRDITSTAFEWEPFSVDESAIEKDIVGASCVIMPSQTEAFGLVALEAIARGTPVIVSSASGLGLLLLTLKNKHPGAISLDSDMVLDVDQDPTLSAKRWVGPILNRLRNRTIAFAKADTLRKDLSRHISWATAVSSLIEWVDTLDFGKAGDDVSVDRRKREPS